MTGYFIVMRRYMYIRRALLATVSSDEFNNMSLKSKLSKVVSYIQDNKAWERIYVILKLLFVCLWVHRLLDMSKTGMGKVLYYSRMTKIFITKSLSDLDNKEISPVP